MGQVKQFQLGIKPLYQSPRKVFVYLPDQYKTQPHKTFDVLYMFDGHNLFFDEVATYGKSWGLKDYLDKTKLPLVVIGVDCSHVGDARLEEYCPFPAKETFWLDSLEAKGQITATWFIEKLIPYCESHFRIQKNRKHIGIGGSSMGGLMSLYMVTKYNRKFSKAMVVSPSLPVCFEEMKDLLLHSKIKEDTRVYLDYGSNEFKTKKSFSSHMGKLLEINHLFQMYHCQTLPNIVQDGTHSEASWETILPTVLPFLYQEIMNTGISK